MNCVLLLTVFKIMSLTSIMWYEKLLNSYLFLLLQELILQTDKFTEYSTLWVLIPWAILTATICSASSIWRSIQMYRAWFVHACVD